ncbi:MAG: hypothetical protein LBT91_03890 [Bifidobacteriaceae bacterium]|jgi:primosomal protein N'|nr:hypothetical protein [Bifidobacteriaceae bacterium]
MLFENDNASKQIIYNIAILNRTIPSAAPPIYQYFRADNFLSQSGEIVRIQFGKGKKDVFGVVLSELFQGEKIYAKSKIIDKVEDISIPKNLIEFFISQSQKYNVSPSNLLKINFPEINEKAISSISKIIAKPVKKSQIDLEFCNKLYSYFFAGQYKKLGQIFQYDNSYNIFPLPGIKEFVDNKTRNNEVKNNRSKSKNNFEVGYFHQTILLVALKIIRAVLDEKKIIVTLPYKKQLNLLQFYLTKLGVSQTSDHNFGDITIYDDDDKNAQFTKYLASLYNKTKVVIGTKKSSFAPLDFDGAIIIDELDYAHRSGFEPKNSLAKDLLDRAAFMNKQLLSFSYIFSENIPNRKNILISNWQNYKKTNNLDFIFLENQPENHFIQNTQNSYISALRLPSKAYQDLKQISKKGPVLVIVSQKTGQKFSLSTTKDWFKKAFGDAVVKISSSDECLSQIDNTPQIIISTLGAEPISLSGYSAIFILEANRYFNYKDINFSAVLDSWMKLISLIQLGTTFAKIYIIGAVPEDISQAINLWDSNLNSKSNFKQLGKAFIEADKKLEIS